MSEHENRAIHSLEDAIRLLKGVASLARLGGAASAIQGNLISRHANELEGILGAMLSNKRARDERR